MPNAIKYSTSPQTLALKKGNFWIGTGDSDKGPTSVTDYWNGISPAIGGYTIYLNKSSQGPSIYTASGSSQLVGLTNVIAGTSFTTTAESLNWFSTQTDKMVFNIDYPQITTNGLVLDVDAAFSPSYPETGSSWYDISASGVTGTLVNSPGYSIVNGGSITFNGVNNYVDIPKQTSLVSASQFTVSAWVTRTASSSPISIWQGPTTSNDVAIKLGTTGAFFEVGNSVTNTFGFVANTSTATQNLVMVFDGTQSGNSNRLKGYIDGTPQTLIYTGTVPATSGTVDSAFYVGNTGGHLSDGSVSSIQIYNRALSAAEVLSNYNAQLRISYDADALAYITEAGFTNPSLNDIINTFFIDLKATGQYSKISLMKLFLTDSTNNTTSLFQCGINAVNPAANVPTYFNAPIANYSGILYNGTTQYAIMNFNPTGDANWTLTSATIMVYNGINVTGRMLGMRNTALSSTQNIYMDPSTTGSFGSGVNDSTAGLTFSGLDALGFFASYRNANNSTKYYFRNNNTILTQTGVAANGIPNVNMYEGGFTLDGGTTISSHSNTRPQFILVGGGMTDSEVNSIQVIVNNLQGSIDTLFGLTGTDIRKKY